MRFFITFCLCAFWTVSAYSQRCAVLEFRAGAGTSQADVDGISEMFITYFHPQGYTMVERAQIDRAIDEQGFQRSNMTEYQMVRLGQILNVSKIVVGVINNIRGEYNIDARVINVESGTLAATEGVTFTSGMSYRSTMQGLAQRLSEQIAISSSSVSTSGSSASNSRNKRSSVETLYGYLRVFPNELGDFQSIPHTIISQINVQSQYGINDWRVPTNEELSLLRANDYLGLGGYMTKENPRGIVLLVSDGSGQINDEQCIKYLSYYQEYYKQMNYDSALPYWRKAYAVCPPTKSQNLFVHGSTLMNREINKNRKNPALFSAQVDSLLKLQDERLRFYPRTAKGVDQKATILNNKGQYMIYFRSDDYAYLYYNLLTIIHELGGETKLNILVNYFAAAVNLYRNGKLNDKEVIQAYNTVSHIIADVHVVSEETDKARSAIESLYLDYLDC